MGIMDLRSKVPEGESGSWRVERFKVSEREARFANIRSAWSPGCRSIEAGRYTRLMRGKTVIMSDTPAELRDHLEFRYRARGHVLINGLGLGLAAIMAAQKDEVESVTVVELSDDVRSLVCPYMPEKVTVVASDAFTWRPPACARYDAVWHDIWDDICADNLPEMHKLHRRYGRRADWQGSWCRELCERYAA